MITNSTRIKMSSNIKKEPSDLNAHQNVDVDCEDSLISLSSNEENTVEDTSLYTENETLINTVRGHSPSPPGKQSQHVKRPMNAFMIFSRMRRSEMAKKGIHQREISKQLSTMWRNLDSDAKQEYIKQAKLLQMKHKEKYPDYKYQPRRRRKEDNYQAVTMPECFVPVNRLNPNMVAVKTAQNVTKRKAEVPLIVPMAAIPNTQEGLTQLMQIGNQLPPGVYRVVPSRGSLSSAQMHNESTGFIQMCSSPPGTLAMVHPEAGTTSAPSFHLQDSVRDSGSLPVEPENHLAATMAQAMSVSPLNSEPPFVPLPVMLTASHGISAPSPTVSESQSLENTPTTNNLLKKAKTGRSLDIVAAYDKIEVKTENDPDNFKEEPLEKSGTSESSPTPNNLLQTDDAHHSLDIATTYDKIEIKAENDSASLNVEPLHCSHTHGNIYVNEERDQESSNVEFVVIKQDMDAIRTHDSSVSVVAQSSAPTTSVSADLPNSQMLTVNEEKDTDTACTIKRKHIVENIVVDDVLVTVTEENDTSNDLENFEDSIEILVSSDTDSEDKSENNPASNQRVRSSEQTEENNQGVNAAEIVNDVLARKDQPPRQHIRRPMNAFMCFARNLRREMSKKDPTIHHSVLSVIIGKKWKAMTAEEKAPYVQEAKELVAELKRKHPDYKYHPKKRKRKESDIVSFRNKLRQVQTGDGNNLTWEQTMNQFNIQFNNSSQGYAPFQQIPQQSNAIHENPLRQTPMQGNPILPTPMQREYVVEGLGQQVLNQQYYNPASQPVFFPHSENPGLHQQHLQVASNIAQGPNHIAVSSSNISHTPNHIPQTTNSTDAQNVIPNEPRHAHKRQRTKTPECITLDDDNDISSTTLDKNNTPGSSNEMELCMPSIDDILTLSNMVPVKITYAIGNKDVGCFTVQAPVWVSHPVVLNLVRLKVTKSSTNTNETWCEVDNKKLVITGGGTKQNPFIIEKA